MREILFRGKRVDNGKWMYGSLYVCGRKDGKCEIANYDRKINIERFAYEVIPETVGQYTGLTDKTGNKIFEGDILVTPLSYIGTVMDIVEYKNGSFVRNNGRRKNPYLENGSASRIIGNIHDNPELLGGVGNG